LDEKAPVIAKLADFGMSRRAFSVQEENQKNNPRWLSPEAMDQQEITNKADIYGFGVLLWEMASRGIYMDEKFMHVISEKVRAGIRPQIPSDCHLGVASLITSCWVTQAEARPEITSVITSIQDIMLQVCPQLVEVSLLEPKVTYGIS